MSTSQSTLTVIGQRLDDDTNGEQTKTNWLSSSPLHRPHRLSPAQTSAKSMRNMTAFKFIYRCVSDKVRGRFNISDRRGESAA